MGVVTGLKIGEVSRQTGVAVGAIRYYESLGLLTCQRGDNGYRYYSSEALQQVHFVKKAQSLGFSLEEIGEILHIHRQGNVPCQRVQSILQEKIDQLEAQIRDMSSFKQGLERYRDSWTMANTPLEAGNICPLIETVSL
ncbi:MAG: heavy metal-responsive transcriptional regulator [Cyanobacteria bacterium J06621_3]